MEEVSVSSCRTHPHHTTSNGADSEEETQTTLATIGERCLHLVCQFIRAHEEDEAVKSLSRLSQVSRRLYFAVRNLPPCQEHFVVVEIPRQAERTFTHYAYWSSIGGVLWKVDDVKQREELVAALQSMNPKGQQASTSWADHNAYFQASLTEFKQGDGGGEGESGPVAASYAGYHTLDFRRCATLQSVDVASFSSVHTLNLSGCSTLTDVSALARVHTLDLSWCRSLIDVSALGLVHNLNLSHCWRITDVTPLGGVHTLNLSHIMALTDVSALGLVHSLDLRGCASLTSVNCLGRVHTLNLSMCWLITDVSGLGAVHTLNLSQCSSISDVGALANVNVLDLTGCSSLSAPVRTSEHVLGARDVFPKPLVPPIRMHPPLLSLTFFGGEGREQTVPLSHGDCPPFYQTY